MSASLENTPSVEFVDGRIYAKLTVKNIGEKTTGKYGCRMIFANGDSETKIDYVFNEKAPGKQNDRRFQCRTIV